MKVFNCFEISASGLSAERLRMDVIANNLANAETTRTPEGGPYRREMVVFAPRGGDQQPFRLPFQMPAAVRELFSDGGKKGAGAGNLGDFRLQRDLGQGVRVVSIVSDPGPGHLVYEPGNPDADAKGYVAMPNVSTVNEMVDMISAQRAYEADVSAIQSAKNMAQQAISIVGQSTAY